jgi:hypothetical protein
VLGTIVVIIIVLAVGARSSDAVSVRQQEIILRNLPEKEAVAYYQLIRKRFRKVAVLRVIAICSLAVLFYSYKYRLGTPRAGAPVTQTK